VWFKCLRTARKVLSGLPAITDPNVLVGSKTADGTAVYRLSDGLALIKTVDFFTPVVDDPYWFGAVAAANSLSDVYAMGGWPVLGLNIVGFPRKKLLLCNAQTSGGLLLAIAPSRTTDLISHLTAARVLAVEIGEFLAEPKRTIEVVP